MSKRFQNASVSVLERANGGVPKGLAYALTASIIAHVAVLVAFPDLRTYSPSPATAKLTAVIVPAKPPVEEPPAPEATAGERKVEPPRPQRPRAAAKAPAPVQRTPSAAPVPPAEPPHQVDPVMQGNSSASPAVATEDSPPVATANESALANKAGEQALDIGSLGKYRFALSGAMARYKTYPEIARERGWEGRPVVRFSVGANGTARVQLKASSGRDVLDRAALEMAEQAQRLVPVPPALHGSEFTVEVPVVYELREER
jgi:periplasmic protein TonB